LLGLRHIPLCHFDCRAISCQVLRTRGTSASGHAERRQALTLFGETWTSETSLFYIIKSLFPTHFIRRHYRPEFLQGLELDIFIEELKIGIEYQGIQHFQPIEHWGGKIAYLKLIERDARRKKYVKNLG
jgi:hypothetical protein